MKQEKIYIIFKNRKKKFNWLSNKDLKIFIQNKFEKGKKNIVGIEKNTNRT